MKNRVFVSENFQFLEVKFSVYLNTSFGNDCPHGVTLHPCLSIMPILKILIRLPKCAV